MFITIFTPTYNRAYCLQNLYESLCRQSSKNFEWLVLDDGSTDHTEDLVKRWEKENKITICYIKQINSGKHSAINRGVGLSKSDLFFIVDSDDYLTDDAVSLINEYYLKLPDNIAGLCFRRCTQKSHKVIGAKFPEQQFYASPQEILFQYKINGDMAEIFKTDILKKYPFPIFERENFVPESLVWNRIGDDYKLLYIDRPIYLCEYINDGLSQNFSSNLKKNPLGFRVYYYETMRRRNIPLIARIKFGLRVIQCTFYNMVKGN